jgi:hypothetical protein
MSRKKRDFGKLHDDWLGQPHVLNLKSLFQKRKMLYENLCWQYTFEFEGIVKFLFQSVLSPYRNDVYMISMRRIKLGNSTAPFQAGSCRKEGIQKQKKET